MGSLLVILLLKAALKSVSLASSFQLIVSFFLRLYAYLKKKISVAKLLL